MGKVKGEREGSSKVKGERPEDGGRRTEGRLGMD